MTDRFSVIFNTSQLFYPLSNRCHPLSFHFLFNYSTFSTYPFLSKVVRKILSFVVETSIIKGRHTTLFLDCNSLQSTISISFDMTIFSFLIFLFSVWRKSSHIICHLMMIQMEREQLKHRMHEWLQSIARKNFLYLIGMKITDDIS